MLATTLVTDVAELAAHAAAWAALLPETATDEPVLSPTWMLAWWDVFGGTDGRALRALCFHDPDGTLIGLAPLLARTVRHRGLLTFRRLELLCSGEDEADEICSDYLGLLARRGREGEVGAAIARALLDGTVGTWDELVLPAMSAASPVPDALVRALHDGDVHTTISEPSVCQAAALPATWDKYLASLGQSHRYGVKRGLRDFEAWAGTRWELRIATTPAEIPAARAVLESLHGERWGGDGRDGGAFSSARFRGFHDRVLPELAARGQVELVWLEVDGVPIAATYNVLWNQKLYFYQSGRSLDVPKGVKPGLVIHALAIRRSIELGRREYDFLGGVSQYKRQLATVGHPLIEVRAVRRGAREAARRAIEAGLELARVLRRRLRPPTAPAAG